MKPTSPKRSHTVPIQEAAPAPGLGLRIAMVLLGIGALLSLASAVLALAAHLQDSHVGGGIGSGTYAAPGIVLALLFALSAWAGSQGSRGFCIAMCIATIICAVVIFFVVGILLGYDCMDYNANPLTMTGCRGSVPSPTGQLIAVATLTIAVTPLVAVVAMVSALVRTGRKKSPASTQRR